MVYCSFCGKNQEEVKKIIAGNGVFICNECVALSQEIIREEMAEEVLADLAETPKPKELLDILNNYVVGQDLSLIHISSHIGLWQMMSNAKPDFFSLWFMALNQFR